ncbi:MAG: hypothetical protein IKG70_08525 [Lachnospiraceae bacterium]|nr:hypothetical protein [Lachnospiraceae bacterium]
MKKRNTIALISLLALMVFGLVAVNYAYKHDMKSYDGSDTDVVALYNDPENYDVSDAKGVADVIVKENLSKTMAANNTAAVVFDFRGYDTLGESFILLTAIAGSFAILGRHIKRKEGESV